MMEPGVHENKALPFYKQEVRLEYVKGELPGVPQHDLNPREVMLYGGTFYLTQTGVFKEPSKPEGEKEHK